LTLVVAMGLGWFVRERHHQAEAARLTHEAEKWRIRSHLETGGLGSRGKPILEPDN
jgi:hypothetical protein